MKIGILAVQGAFAEHEKVLSELGADYGEIRQRKDALEKYDGIILPGGESTTQGKLLFELMLFEPLLAMIRDDIPVLATCAGMILLSEKIEDQKSSYFASMPITVRRNAYGRQLGSFHTTENYKGLGDIPMTFIRAPYVTEVRDGAEILSSVDTNIVAVKYRNQTALSFHPELDENYSIHKSFLSLCKAHGKISV